MLSHPSRLRRWRTSPLQWQGQALEMIPSEGNDKNKDTWTWKSSRKTRKKRWGKSSWTKGIRKLERLSSWRKKDIKKDKRRNNDKSNSRRKWNLFTSSTRNKKKNNPLNNLNHDYVFQQIINVFFLASSLPYSSYLPFPSHHLHLTSMLVSPPPHTSGGDMNLVWKFISVKRLIFSGTQMIETLGHSAVVNKIIFSSLTVLLPLESLLFPLT